MECLASPPIDPSKGRLTSGFGMRIGHSSGQPSFHAGNDFNAHLGDSVYAVRRGTVALVMRDAPVTPGFVGYGNAVVIHHPQDGVWTLYAHLSATFVRPGAEVIAGQHIGNVGRSNNGKFPGMPAHLHFETRFARADGSSPFPGAYREFNMDPQTYLRELEVGSNWRGRFSLGQTACRPWSSPRLRGLGQLGQGHDGGTDGSTSPMPRRDDNDAYEPPRQEWFYLLFGSNLAVGAVIGGTVLLVVGALAFAEHDTREQRRRRRR